MSQFHQSKKIIITMQLRKIKGSKVYFVSENGDVFRLMKPYKRNQAAKTENTLRLCENGLTKIVSLTKVMREVFPEYFNIDLTEFFSAVEYDLWQGKLNSMPKIEWKEFNDVVYMAIRKNRIYDRGTPKRKEVLERLFKV